MRDAVRWSRRLAAVGLALLAATLLPAAPASAHSVGGVGATNFQTTLSALTPAVPGVTLRVIENGAKLELDNTTGADVIVAGYAGEPYARVGPAGVFLNDNSPATYLNADRYSTVAVPAGVNPAASPRWRQVATTPVLQWHDHRVHWMLQTLPAPVAADPGSRRRISTWSVVLAYAPTDSAAGTGGQQLVATGSLDWVPGPSPWPWLLLAAAVAALVAAAPYLSRPQRALAIATAAMVGFDILHGVGVMLVTTGSLPERLGALFGADALLIWPFAILAAVLLWRRLTRAAWLAAGVGAIIAATIAVDDAPDLWRSSAPTLWPANVNRAAVAIVIGAGVGLAIGLPLLLRRHVPRAAPWTPAPLPESTVDADRADVDPADPGTGVAAGARTGAEVAALSADPAPAGGAGPPRPAPSRPATIRPARTRPATTRPGGSGGARWLGCSPPAPSGRSPAPPGDWPSAADRPRRPHRSDPAWPTSVPGGCRSSVNTRPASPRRTARRPTCGWPPSIWSPGRTRRRCGACCASGARPRPGSRSGRPRAARTTP